MINILDRLTTGLADRYVIERELGAGGMATVYLAHDVKHERQVALKVLRPELAAVLGAERFLNEIKVTANLQHPNILALYESGEVDSFLYYVMPYVEGETLREMLAKEKQLAVDQAVGIATEIASAMDYAHRKGVIHRDLKPENILLHEGKALVADFGIALAVSHAGGTRLTETGLSIGTPHYMSPEQATGDREVDARSDVYSLGAVVYEMLAGDPPHMGSTVQAIVAQILTEEPRPLSSRRRTVPPNVEAAVHHSLEKLPADRFTSAADFAAALRDKTFSTPQMAGTDPSRPTVLASHARRVLPWLVAAAAAVAVLVMAVRRVPPPPVVRVAVSLPADQPLVTGDGPSVALSPDGLAMVYSGVYDGTQQLLVRSLGQLDAEPIPGTEGGGAPFFSPDGRWLGFFAGGRLKKVSLDGGPPLTLADAATPRGGTWTDAGYIVFTPTTAAGLFRVSADGGPTEPLTTVPADGVISHRWPTALPGGRGVLFTTYTANFAESGIAFYSLDTKEVVPLISGATGARYVPSGHLLYASTEGTLVGMRFDAERLDTIGPATTLLEGVSVNASTAAGMFAVSDNGTLAYLSGSLLSALTRVNRDGSEEVLADSLTGPSALRFSPDGSRLAMELQEGATTGVWVYDLARRSFNRLTFEGLIRYPAWDPTGTRLLYSLRTGAARGMDLFQIAADGSSPPESLYAAPDDQYEGLWTPDGTELVVRQTVAATARDIWRVPLTGGAPREFLRTPLNERSIALSPDGRWLAYTSNESGVDEVYVRAFPGPGGKWQVSVGGGTEAAWSKDGRDLFYRGPQDVMAVSVETRPAFRLGSPQVLFRDIYLKNGDHTDYDVHPSGRWFAMARSASRESGLILVFNWGEELVGRVGR